MALRTINCLFCKKEFTTPLPKKKYCTVACGARYRAARAYKENNRLSNDWVLEHAIRNGCKYIKEPIMIKKITTKTSPLFS